MVNNVVYYGINSCAYFWQEYGEHHCFSEKNHNLYPMLKNMVLYKEALYSIVEIDNNQNLRITGMEGHYLNITPEVIGMPYLLEGVSISPRTISLSKQQGVVTIF